MPRKKKIPEEKHEMEYQPVDFVDETVSSPRKNSKEYILFGLLVVAAFLIGSLWSKVRVLEQGGVSSGVKEADVGQVAGDDGAAVPADTTDKLAPVGKDDHVKGNRDAEIALVEYSDYECPFCKRFHPTAQQAVDEYKGRVMWVYRHFPLSFHANAQKEAEASECANEIGGNDAFWRYTDTLVERTETGGTGFALEKLVPLAGEIGLNTNTFKQCLDSGKYVKPIQEEMQNGSEAGVNGTPGTIVVNTKTGKKKLVSGAVGYETLKKAIDELLL